MSGVTQPRGKLPARVYWTRRAIVLAVPLLLIFVLIKLLGGSDAPAPKADTAAQTASRTKPTPTVTPSGNQSANQTGSQPGNQGATKPGKQPKGKARTALAAPQGVCLPSQVDVRPVIKSAYAARDNRIQLRLTGVVPACTFTVSHDSVALRITSGSDRIWSTQDCRAAIKEQDVVVRAGVAAVVDVVWSGRRSIEGDCTDQQAYAKPGYYHASASTLGGEPRDTQFKMTLAPRRTITKTIAPKPTATATSKPTATKSAGTR